MATGARQSEAGFFHHYYLFSKRVLSCDPTVTLWDFTLWARRARALVLRTLDRTLGGLPAAGCVNPARHMEAADLCRRNCYD